MDGIQEADGALVEGGEVSSGESETLPETNLSDVGDTTPQEEPAPETLKESARETVARLAREMVDGTGEKKSQPSEQKTSEVVRKEGEVKPEVITEADKFDPALATPQRLSPEAKVFFDKAPKWMKKEFNRNLKDLESWAGKTVHQAQQSIQSVKSITDAVMPFAADWAKRHVSVPQGVSELCGMYARLCDPKSAAQEYVELGQKLRVDFDQLATAVKSGQVPGIGQVQTENPQFTSLQEKQNALESKITEWQTQQAVQPIVNEMAAVKYEVDSNTGKYRYPELHDANYLRSLSERVSELVNNFGQTHSDALKRANSERKNALFGIPIESQTTRPPSATTNNNINKKAVSAAVTVRGKTSPSLANNGGAGSPPPEALKSARATAAWVLKTMQNGGGS